MQNYLPEEYVKSDIYWTHVCISSLKYNDSGTFFYGFHHIHNPKRKRILVEIKVKFIRKDEEIIQTLNKYNCIPIIVT